MWLVGLLCMKSKKTTSLMMVAMVLIFTVGITFCFAVAMLGRSRSGMTMSPAFLPDSSVLRQVVRIAFISPWGQCVNPSCLLTVPTEVIFLRVKNYFVS